MKNIFHHIGRFCMSVAVLMSFVSVHAQDVFTDATLSAAVDELVADPVSAEVTYGHISTWNTSAVTDMNQLFRDKTSFNDEYQQLGREQRDEYVWDVLGLRRV